MDGRRHSVDVPLSKTLIALRRVRSLRDPSTNSMSKLAAFIDNLNWETNSNNVIASGFENSCRRIGIESDFPRLRSSPLAGENEEHWGDNEQCGGSRLGGVVGNVGSIHHRSLQVDCLDAHPVEREMVRENERYCNEYGNRENEFEGGVLCNGRDEVLKQVKKRRSGGAKYKSQHRKLDGFSRATATGVVNRAGSPCSSVGEAPKARFGNAMSPYRTEDFGLMESCHQGCGIGSCWTRNWKCREPNVVADVEEEPLLLENAGPLSMGENMDCNHRSTTSLCQKYMPKSFSELVGQSTVATSLLNAISKRQIASLYLFHGPRGTGKTSASRVFASALNCLSAETSARPCGSCQECTAIFSGRSRDVNEVDSTRINQTERCRSFIKNAGIPPVFSRYKVYVIDECHLLHRETWAIILNSLDELPPHVVLIMVTPNLDKLPRNVVSKSQRHHLQKVREVDISSKLRKICVQEGFDFDLDALNFIASKSNGSLRDAEMMLDQLSLLGKKITLPLVYEVNGVVSDDELLDLLYLALSSDASNTVKRARELMQSRIDPLQLISQLASIIMDLLSGKCPDGASEKRVKLLGNNSEADTQHLSNALKILSQTEKQLRMSNNQSTWLTAALLQLSSAGSSHDMSDARLSVGSLHPQDGDFLSTLPTSESLRRPVACACADAEPGKKGLQFDKETLELVWIRATQMCTSSSLKKFLLKRGKLVSIHLTQGIAVVDLEFDHPDNVSKAEKSWKEIAGLLQHMVGYNVELRINLAKSDSNIHARLKKPSFSLFNCSRRVHLHSHSSAESQSIASENSGSTPTAFVSRNRYTETCTSSDSGSQISCACCHGKELFKTIRSNDGNALSIDVAAPSGCPNSISKQPGLKEYSKFHCWRTTMFPFRKAWQLRHHQPSERLVDYALHCAAAN